MQTVWCESEDCGFGLHSTKMGPNYYECDGGHIWTTESFKIDSQGDYICPSCNKHKLVFE